MAAISVSPVPILSARAAADFVAPLLYRATRERLVVLHLDRDRRHLRTTELEGCAVEVTLPVRLILAAALECDAHGLILAHNHPSGDPTPSRADRIATQRLVAAAAPLGITLHDHLVFGADSCRSFRELGLL